ncbi:LysR family transcriptional regulator [Alcaligenaceae bacterium]|nr:LysR family transcriptional regulator [Alcaligenaceae bacterium]
MQDLNDLYYYVQVVDYAGFAPAGRALGVPKSKLSRRIALLEERLGVRLLQRSTRRFSVTEIGQTYYSHCKAMLVEAAAAQEAIDITRSDPQGTVRITCPVALLHANVEVMLADFMNNNPRVTVHLEATNRRVDPISEGIDIAVRVRPPPIDNSDLVMRVLANRRQCLVASPELIRQFGVPKGPADISNWPSLALGKPQPNHVWNLYGPDGEQASLHHTPRFISDDLAALRTMTVAGIGIAQLPLMMIAEQLAQGTLQPLLKEWAPRPDIVHAVFPSRRGLLPAVRTLVDYLANRFQTLEED